jgi:putative ABC transport system permease protein
MDTLIRDIRYGSRMMLKNPGFTAVAVLALALGIGANTAIFSVVNSVLLRQLPYPHPDRLVMVWETDKNGAPTLVSPGNFADWSEQNETCEQIAALRGWDANLSGVDEPERLRGAMGTARLFDALGLAPMLGRTFSPDEDQPGSNRVVVLGYGLWKRRFGSDPSIVGRTVTINGIDRTVIGIMPAQFKLPIITIGKSAEQTEIWTTWVMDPSYRKRRDVGQLLVVARLKQGATAEQAQAELSAISYRSNPTPTTDQRIDSQVAQLHRSLVGNSRPALLVLFGAVSFVLLIACANVANLLLARAATRQKEIAIRAALGAGRWRIIRQLLTESIVLSLIAAVIGLVFALWCTDALVALSPADLPRLEEIGIDLRVLGFTLVVSLLTGVAFGLAPAWQASTTDLNESLKEGGRTSTAGFGLRRTRHVLVISELALAVVLLVGAGLMIKSFVRLSGVDAGFDAPNVLTLAVSLPGAKYPESEQQAAFFQQVISRIESLAGVQSAGAVSAVPLTGWQNKTSFAIEGRPETSQTEELHAASPGYFQAIGIPLLRGRAFTEQDRSNAERVVIVSEGLAHRYWPDEDPIGRRIQLGGDSHEPWRTIVGIVGDVKQSGLDSESTREYYISYLQDTWGITSDMTLTVRTVSDPLSLVAAARSQVQVVDKDVPAYNIRTMAQLRALSAAPRRFQMILLGCFAGLALLLAAVGLYGVMSYAVTQRTHEIGIRMALGAQSRDVLKLVVSQGLVLTAAGVMIGLVAAFGLSRLIASLLYGVSATDPATFLLVSLLLVAVALLACYLPARRASKTDPMVALRYE